MNIIEEIKDKRNIGVVHCGYGGKADLAAVASSFSLSADTDKYHTIKFDEALQILTRILHKDLAYNGEIMSRPAANSLATRFLSGFEQPDTLFYTNTDFSREGQKLSKFCTVGPDWTPVTEATFDAGVIAISKTQSACLWVEDED